MYGIVTFSTLKLRRQKYSCWGNSSLCPMRKKRVWMINIVSYIGTSLHLDFYLLKPYVKKCFINLFVSIYLVEHRLNSVVEVSGLWTADPEFKSAIGFCSYSTINFWKQFSIQKLQIFSSVWLIYLLSIMVSIIIKQIFADLRNYFKVS